MINLNKKQVGALLKVMGKDDMRPILASVYVDKWGDDTVMVATNGYIMAILPLDNEDAEELVGKMIRREAIERWYKLATGKSRLNTMELVQVASEDYGQHGSYREGNYPTWQSVVPSSIADGADTIAFNADLAKTLQDLDGSDGLVWTVYGKLQPLMASTDNGTYLLMPRKM